MADFDQRQYRLMLDRLVAFDEGRIRLDTLVDDLEGLLNVLAEPDPAWKRTFLGIWGELEEERADALFKEVKAFDEETTQSLRATVAELEQLVRQKIDHGAQQEEGTD
jgi:hypothetical protein